MNLTEIKQVVIDETRRVDKSDQIHRLVREAIQTVHGLRMFPRDMVEDSIALESPLTQFKFQLPPRFRKFEVVAPLSSNGARVATQHPNNQYEEVRPSAIINNSYGDKNDIYYITGPTAAVKSSMAPAGLYLAWYQMPETADPYLETWLMELEFQTIIDTAKKLFYRRNGREDMARQYDADLLGMYQRIVNDYTDAED